MTDMQIEFPKERLRAQVGQKLDATPSSVVSSHANSQIPFGVLVIYDEADALSCKAPTNASELKKPLGITLRSLYGQYYEPKSSIAVLRQGRVWVEADKVNAPGDNVYVTFTESGLAQFTGHKEGAVLLNGAIFLEKSDGGLTPIEINFLGGVA